MFKYLLCVEITIPGAGHTGMYRFHPWGSLTQGIVYVEMCLNSLILPGGSDGKESAYNPGDLGSIPRLGRSPGARKGYLLQLTCLENSMDIGAQQAQPTGSQRVRHN